MAKDKVTESRWHRYRPGDLLSYEDESTWPPTHLEGKLKGFANDEGTHLTVDFDGDVRELTEDEVRRVG